MAFDKEVRVSLDSFISQIVSGMTTEEVQQTVNAVNANRLKMNEVDEAIQEFEDNAFHHSLHPVISDKSLSVALKALCYLKVWKED